jgi:2-polyprenyl-3-methyl-5-hydroxy-6-metoxy-1,4-benzoquinol methylase
LVEAISELAGGQAGPITQRAREVLGTCPACGGAGSELPQYRSVFLRECACCGLIFLDGGSLPRVRERYADGSYEMTHLDHFEEERIFKHIAEQRTRWLLKMIEPGALLELGPGRGFFLDATRRSGFDPIGVDPSPDLAARAAAEFGVPVECGFLEEVDLPHDSFDAICMFHVFEHVDDPVGMLRQLRGMLGERGLLMLEVPNISSAMARRRAERWAAVQPVELHVSHFTPASLGEVVERAGLETVAMDTISPWHYIPPADRWRHRALLGYAYRAARLRTLRATHRSGFDHLRLVARAAS